jgi:hypothetical protein
VQQQAEAAGGGLALACGSTLLRKIFSVTALDSVLRVRSSRTAAIAAVLQAPGGAASDDRGRRESVAHD